MEHNRYVDWKSVNEEIKGEEERGKRGQETRRRGEEEESERRGGGAVFLAMQVLEIPAGGRGFPLVDIIWTRSPVTRDKSP